MIFIPSTQDGEVESDALLCMGMRHGYILWVDPSPQRLLATLSTSETERVCTILDADLGELTFSPTFGE